MHILNLKDNTEKYIDAREHELNSAFVNRISPPKLGKFILDNYKSPHYGIIRESDDGFVQHNKQQLKHAVGRLLIASMHIIGLFDYNGLRTIFPNVQIACIGLFNESTSKLVEVKLSDVRRVLLACYDGTAYIDEIDTREDVDKFLAEVSKLTGVPIGD